MILFRALARSLIRIKGWRWVALNAFRVYQHLPRFAQRRVRKRAIRAALPLIVNKLTKKTDASPR
jgi:hypothetical protein